MTYNLVVFDITDYGVEVRAPLIVWHAIGYGISERSETYELIMHVEREDMAYLVSDMEAFVDDLHIKIKYVNSSYF